MLFLSSRHAVANMLSMVKSRTGSWPPDAGLRETYLGELRSALSVPLTVGDDIAVSFEETPLAQTAAQQALFAGEGQKLGSTMNDDEKATVRANIQAALILLRVLDRSLYNLAWFQLSDVVCARVEGSGGGTSSNLLGVIWLSPHPRWTTIDYAECLLHEAIHLNVFLGDLTQRLYVDARRVREPGALVMSAVRQERRPIDKSLHSACVAVALAYFYHLLGEEETSASFLPPLATCVEEMAAVQHAYLAPYGQLLVRDLQRFVEDPDCARLQAVLADEERVSISMPA